MQSPSTSDSFDSYLNFSPPAPKSQSRKRKRSDFVHDEDEDELSQEVVSEMSKRIKLLDDEIKSMTEI